MQPTSLCALLATLALVPAASAQGGFTPPSDLAPGQPYRVLFLTESRIEAASSDIGVYNGHVQADADANPSLAALGTTWRAIASTASVDARTNTDTDPTPPGSTGVPVYRPDGTRLADDYDHLWDSDGTALLATPSGATSGGTMDGAWTGTHLDGTASTRPLGGELDPVVGRHWETNSDWVLGYAIGNSQGIELRMYGLSDVLAVPFEAPSDLAPGAPYHVLFVTEGVRDATSADIADYNAFVAAEAADSPALANFGSEWKALASTANVSARDNTSTDASAAGIQGVPVYRPDGVRIADDYDDLWDAFLAGTPSVTSSGATFSGSFVWTGTLPDGAGGSGAELGSTVTLNGDPLQIDVDWIAFFAQDPTAEFPFYALSGVLHAPLPSTETVRLGTPANPNVLLPGQTSGPVLGQVWDPIIDHTSFATDAVFDFLALTPGPANLPLGAMGTLLCDLSWMVVVPTAPGVPFAVPFSNDPSLLGLGISTQGASIDAASQVRLTNALDITFGNV